MTNIDAPKIVATPRPTLARKFNAMRHGIFAAVLLKDEPFKESEETYRSLLNGLRKDWRPVGETENTLVEKLAFLFLRQARIYKIDARIIPLAFENIETFLQDGTPRFFTEVKSSDEVAIVRRELPADLLIRYETALERSIDRTFSQLDRMQELRAGRPVPPTARVQVESAPDAG